MRHHPKFKRYEFVVPYDGSFWRVHDILKPIAEGMTIEYSDHKFVFNTEDEYNKALLLVHNLQVTVRI